MTLDGLEAVLQKKYATTRTGTVNSNVAAKHQVNLVRYADDFIITGKSRELLEDEVKPLVESFLAERGLILSPEKTKVVHIDEGFDFLGWSVRKYDGKLMIKPSKQNVNAFLDDIRETVKENKQATQASLIGLLNPKIRGWTNYHKGVVAKATFAKVDHEIWKTLWQWAKRRHPNKSAPWIKKRYFQSIGNRNWIFAANGEVPNGKPKHVRLVLASDTKIRRHVKIRGEANPFDPKLESYFESRLGWKMMDNLKGRNRLRNLWWNQEGNCPNCDQKITKDTGWNVHHILPKSEGGKDKVGSLVMMHPNCHRQMHCQKNRRCTTGSCKGALKRLEPCAGKLACTVLRGGSSGNVVSLPDSDVQKHTPGAAWLCGHHGRQTLDEMTRADRAFLKPLSPPGNRARCCVSDPPIRFHSRGTVFRSDRRPARSPSAMRKTIVHRRPKGGAPSRPRHRATAP